MIRLVVNRHRLIVIGSIAVVALILIIGIVFLLVGPTLDKSTTANRVIPVTLYVDGNRNAYTKSTIVLPAGAPIRMVFVNSSRLKPHNWIMGREFVKIAELVQSGLNSRSSREFIPNESLIHAATPLVAPRARVVIKSDAPHVPGNYAFLCTVPGHSEDGMHGKLIVVAK